MVGMEPSVSPAEVGCQRKWIEAPPPGSTTYKMGEGATRGWIKHFVGVLCLQIQGR